MRIVLPLALVLASCAVEPTDALTSAEVLPAEALPPVFALNAFALIPGQFFSLSANGLPPATTVHFLRSTSTGTACPGALGGECLGISSPIHLGSATAAADGRAIFTAALPATLPIGLDMNFQAAVAGTPGSVSNVLTRTTESLCGDGVQQQDETCDDRNTLSGDGCSDTCQTEAANDTFSITVHSARLPAINPDTGLAWDDILVLPMFTPPDPYVEVSLNGVSIGETLVQEDTLTPTWSSRFTVTVGLSDELTFDVYDADTFPLSDELIDGGYIDQAFLNQLDGSGAVSLSVGIIDSLVIEVTSAP
jgi:cysteine-rich repeat protein